MKLALLIVLALCAGCESERTIMTAKRPATMRCIPVNSSHAVKGIKYELSVRNTAVGIIFVEIVAPPIVVLAKETWCPVADTTMALR